MTAEGSGLIPSLRRVLLAYSKRNPSVGYCQGMNFVCAMSEPNLARQPAIQPARWGLGQPCLSIKPLLRFDGLACLLACLSVPDVLRRCCWHAVLLFMGEEEAFWLLSVVCEDYFSESYTLDMAGKQYAIFF